MAGSPTYAASNAALVERRRASNAALVERRRAADATRRASRWLVQIVMLATTSFALLDLYLLLTSSHH
ncbi:MAG TPA: hypothetical protein VID75_02160 [Acidimicrobiales bacterium]